MQFKVPQFLEIEDKIFGPFTFREFVYLAGGGGVCFVLYKLLGLFWGAIPILISAGFALALTFYKPNSKPFISMIEAGFKYAMGNKLFIWERSKNKIQNKISAPVGMDNTIKNQIGAKLSSNRLRDLAWSLDILDLKKQESTGN